MHDLAVLMNSPKYKSYSTQKDPWKSHHDLTAFHHHEDSPILFINLKMNNFRSINQVLRDCNIKLQDGGWVAGYFESLIQRKRKIRQGRNKFFQFILIHYDFWLRRVFPKLPIIRNLDNRFHLVRNRSLSRCEMFGRLHYCGFDIIEFRNDNDYFYFKAKRIKDSPEEDIHYGIFIKLARVGKFGKIFNMYKLRTMHPYAPFIHDYILNNHGFAESGKIKDDFRIPDWGRVIRKLWLDETPQIINLLKGDINLVGVRPLSMTMYRSYPEDLKQERIQFKPGLIPPYYVDLPANIEEVHESERRYIARKKEKPFSTDFIYFFKAMHNILIKGARSG